MTTEGSYSGCLVGICDDMLPVVSWFHATTQVICLLLQPETTSIRHRSTRSLYTYTQTMLRKFEFLLFRNMCVAAIISSLAILMHLSPTRPQHAILM